MRYRKILNLGDWLWLAALVTLPVLKLTGVVDWPWVWVLSPAWYAILMLAIALVVVGVLSYLSNALDDLVRRAEDLKTTRRRV